jgi:predicted amidohydrolase
MMPRIACIQLTSSEEIAENIAHATPLMVQAVEAGARLLVLPENAFYMRHEGKANPAVPVAIAQHEGVQFCSSFAATHHVWVVVGSVRAKAEGSDKALNRQVVIAPDGSVAATYDKLHLFDVTLPTGQHYRESAQFAAGEHAVLCHASPFGALGLSICYDLRFPHLYGALARAGATLLLVPSAFTRPTGKAHWQVLLRARAIETGCYLVAPAQCGIHPGGRETYGHSMIISPWGEILAEAGDSPTMIHAAYDEALVQQTRAHIPVLAHYRAIEVKEVTPNVRALPTC